MSVITRRSFGRQFHSAGPEKEKACSANFGFCLFVMFRGRPQMTSSLKGRVFRLLWRRVT